jgi:hypothetical protein
MNAEGSNLCQEHGMDLENKCMLKLERPATEMKNTPQHINVAIRSH